MQALAQAAAQRVVGGDLGWRRCGQEVDQDDDPAPRERMLAQLAPELGQVARHISSRMRRL
jgi:hypothetical protein